MKTTTTIKKLLLLLSAIFFINTTYAAQWSVSNVAQAPGQFASIAAAIANGSVANYDTLLVQPSSIGYSAFTLSKPLTIIGGGFNTNKVPQVITNITGTISLTNTCGGSRFYGLKHSIINSPGTGGTVSNLLFEDCWGVNDMQFSGSSWIFTNLVIRNCIETNIVFNSSTSTSAVISNCIFYSGNGPQSSKGSVLVSNCLFMGTTHLAACENVTIQNCVFQNSLFSTTTFNNSFNNCFFYNVTGLSTTTPPLPVGNGTVSSPGNSGAKDSTMSVSPFADGHTASTLSLTGSINYHLTGSGLTYSTTGGTIGVYGGTSTFSLTGEPLNSAIIRSFIINNTTVPVNGNLNINLMVTKPITN